MECSGGSVFEQLSENLGFLSDLVVTNYRRIIPVEVRYRIHTDQAPKLTGGLIAIKLWRGSSLG